MITQGTGLVCTRDHLDLMISADDYYCISFVWLDRDIWQDKEGLVLNLSGVPVNW